MKSGATGNEVNKNAQVHGESIGSVNIMYYEFVCVFECTRCEAFVKEFQCTTPMTHFTLDSWVFIYDTSLQILDETF